MKEARLRVENANQSQRQQIMRGHKQKSKRHRDRGAVDVLRVSVNQITYKQGLFQNFAPGGANASCPNTRGGQVNTIKLIS